MIFKKEEHGGLFFQSHEPPLDFRPKCKLSSTVMTFHSNNNTSCRGKWNGRNPRGGVQAARPIKNSIKMIMALLFMLAYNTADFDVSDQKYNDEVTTDVH